MIDVIADRIVRKNPFLCDWSNYGIIDIFNPVATAQYQHSVTIPTKPGMMHDFRDLRFFQPDGTEIPFWNESKTDGSTSFNWIKPYSASQRKVYVFYGNRDAVSQSNGDKVFEFFDDFLGSALDTSKWTIGAGSPSVSGSIITLSGEAQIYPKSFVPTFQSYAPRSLLKYTTNSKIFGFEYYATGSKYIGFESQWLVAGKAYSLTQVGPTAPERTITDIGTSYANGYHIFDFKSSSASSTIFSVDNSVLSTHTTTIPTGNVEKLSLYAESGQTLYSDWILVRKYTATEPTCQFNQYGMRT